jgi:hypothetical protein
MPALPDAVPMSPAEIALWAGVLVCATAATVRVLYRSLSRAPATSAAGMGEPDALFWNVFTGLVVIIPAMLIPAVLSPVIGLLLLGLGAAAAFLTLTGSRKLAVRQGSKPGNRPGFSSATARHNAVLRQWSRYELDPGQAIEFPGMSDVRIPETAELFRAMREAQRCRLAADTDYVGAVERLENAFSAAEKASGAFSISS